MLPGVLALHDVRDVEGFCVRIIRGSSVDLDADRYEDLLTYLIETAWELSKIEPRQWDRSFSGWAHPLLRLRVVDWQRSKYRTKWQFKDRTYERPIPVFVSVDDRLGDAYPYELVDVTPDRSTDLMRVLGAGDSPDTRDDVEDGEGENERAA